VAALSAYLVPDIPASARRARAARAQIHPRGACETHPWISARAETFCEETLVGVKEGRDEWELDKTEFDARFDAMPEQRPSTLSDCLAELRYWTDLYWLQNAVDRDGSESGVPGQARKDYTFRCLGRILPRSTEEAHQVLQYLINDNAMGWEESHGILRNLMTQLVVCQAPEVQKPNVTKLRSLRDELVNGSVA
jgi:hypothetical protein